MSCKTDWRWQGKCSSPNCCKGGGGRKSRRKKRRGGQGNNLQIEDDFVKYHDFLNKRLPEGLLAPRWKPGELASHTLISPDSNRTHIKKKSRKPPPPPGPSIKRQRQRAATKKVGQHSKNHYDLGTPLGRKMAKEAARRNQRHQWNKENEKTLSAVTEDGWVNANANSNDELPPGINQKRMGTTFKFTKGGRRKTRRKRGGEIQKLTVTDMLRNSASILGRKINEIIDIVNQHHPSAGTGGTGGRRKTRRNRRHRRKKRRKSVR